MPAFFGLSGIAGQTQAKKKTRVKTQSKTKTDSNSSSSSQSRPGHRPWKQADRGGSSFEAEVRFTSKAEGSLSNESWGSSPSAGFPMGDCISESDPPSLVAQEYTNWAPPAPPRPQNASLYYGLPQHQPAQWAAPDVLDPMPTRSPEHVPPWASSTNVAPQRPPNHRKSHSSPLFQDATPSRQHLMNLPFRSKDETIWSKPHRMDDQMSVLITALDNDADDTSSRRLDPDPSTRGLREEASHGNFDLTGGIRGNLQSRYSKVWHYYNSRLPQHLPPLRVYLPTYRLFCLAARHSLSVYTTTGPSGQRQPNPLSRTATIRVPPSSALGTKAMSLTLIPCVCSNTPTLVLAIRGSATFADWAVNFRPRPASPLGLLDDPGNLVHSGFLQVARSMLVPVAEQLSRALQQINGTEWREQGQLLLCGHSAGGAVASLLFCHILAQSDAVDSPLKDLAAVAFKRVHCITFGAPPITLLPLDKPHLMVASVGNQAARKWEKNLFFSIINEGDPVSRADPAFVKSLIELYARPVPAAVDGKAPSWPVPANKFSNGGRLVILRADVPSKSRKLGLLGLAKKKAGAEPKDEKIEAVVATDEQLRRVVYGDPMVHSMRLYKRRMETLALRAMTGE